MILIKDTDIHPHLKARMQQRGISIEEIQATINNGTDADDAKKGTSGKVYVYFFNEYWEGKYFEEKEISVYFKQKGEELILLTAKARYGKNFLKRGDAK